MRNLQSTNDYINIEQDFKDTVSDWGDEIFQDLKEITFALIGPDGLAPSNFELIFPLIEEQSFEVADFQFLHSIPENKIEALYKYHVPDTIKSRLEYKGASCDFKTFCPYLSLVPTRNWRLLRKRFELRTSVVLILRKPNCFNVPQLFKALKGPTDPNLAIDGQLRNYTDNPVNSFIHSSDDEVSVLREALVFFEKKQLYQTLKKRRVYSYQFFKDVINIVIPDENEFRFLIIALKLRLRIALFFKMKYEQDYFFDFYEPIYIKAKEWKIGKIMLKEFTILLNSEKNIITDYLDVIPADEDPQIAIRLLKSLLEKSTFTNFDIVRFQSELTQINIVYTQQELTILEAGLWYYQDTY